MAANAAATPSGQGGRMTAPRTPVGGFFLRVLLWLPLAFFAWYFTAPVLTLPITLGMEIVLEQLLPDVLRAVEHQGYTVDVVTRFTLAQAGILRHGAEQGLLAFGVNPLIYQYSIPLLFGLVLASPGSEGRKLASMGVGLLVLLPVAAFGVTLEVLKSLAFDFGPAVGATVGGGPVLRNLLALSYQLGYLILPSISPVILWIMLYRDFVAELAPGFTRVARRNAVADS